MKTISPINLWPPFGITEEEPTEPPILGGGAQDTTGFLSLLNLWPPFQSGPTDPDAPTVYPSLIAAVVAYLKADHVTALTPGGITSGHQYLDAAPGSLCVTEQSSFDELRTSETTVVQVTLEIIASSDTEAAAGNLSSYADNYVRARPSFIFDAARARSGPLETTGDVRHSNPRTRDRYATPIWTAARRYTCRVMRDRI